MTDHTKSREIVAFRLADQEYGIEIMTVREIRGWTRATPLPHAPGYVKGVVNLRGAVLPVIDLAARFGLPARQSGSRDVIMVVQVKQQIMGLLVDAVADILSVPQDTVQAVPAVASATTLAFIDCVAAIDDRMIQLINLDRVFEDSRPHAA